MIYNKIHNQFRIGLGLWFRLVFNHKDHPGMYTCVSNIPTLDLKKLATNNFRDAFFSIVIDITCGLDYHDTVEALEAAQPKKLPRIRAGRNGKIKLHRSLADLLTPPVEILPTIGRIGGGTPKHIRP